MTEGFKTKTTPLTDEQVKGLVDTQWGVLKLSKIPANTFLVATPLEEVQDKYIESTDATVHTVLVQFEPKDYQPVQFKIQIGANAVKRLKEKEYVNQKCIFSKTSYQGKFPQFVNPLKNQDAGSPQVEWAPKKESNNLIDRTENTADLPKELEEWFTTFDQNFGKEKFLEAFTNAKILEGTENPQAFMDWVSNKEMCGTDYIAGIQDEQQREIRAMGIFWAIIKRYEATE